MPALVNPRHERFAQEMAKGRSATEAYALAGYKEGRRDAASRLSSKVNIRDRVQELLERAAERTEITIARVLEELAKIGFANAGEFFDWGPDGIKVKDKDGLTPEQQAVVAEVSQTITEKGGTVRVKLHDKLGALEKIGRHLGMFVEKHEHTGKDGGPIATEDVTHLTPVERAQRLAAILIAGAARGS